MSQIKSYVCCYEPDICATKYEKDDRNQGLHRSEIDRDGISDDIIEESDDRKSKKRVKIENYYPKKGNLVSSDDEKVCKKIQKRQENKKSFCDGKSNTHEQCSITIEFLPDGSK